MFLRKGLEARGKLGCPSPPWLLVSSLSFRPPLGPPPEGAVSVPGPGPEAASLLSGPSHLTPSPLPSIRQYELVVHPDIDPAKVYVGEMGRLKSYENQKP